jgi:hypothetical protein
MKNRAKCKLCGDTLESFHAYDYVICKCGEISISGGNDKLECSAKHWENFLRVDDEGNEIIVKINGAETIDIEREEPPILSKKEKLDELEMMLKNIENLPKHAMTEPINHYDMFSFMALVLSILKDEKKS